MPSEMERLRTERDEARTIARAALRVIDDEYHFEDLRYVLDQPAWAVPGLDAEHYPAWLIDDSPAGEDATMVEAEVVPAMTAYRAEKIVTAHQRLEQLANDWKRYVDTPINENLSVHVGLHPGAADECMTIRELRELLEAVLPDAQLVHARKVAQAWQGIAMETAAELRGGRDAAEGGAS